MVPALARQLLLFGALLTPLELMFPARRQRRRAMGLGVDLALAVTNTLVVGLVGLVVLSVISVALRPLVPDVLLDAIAAAPVPAQLALLVVLGEFGGYWTHRLSHRIPVLWRLHAVHHSSEDMNWLSAHRQHPLEVLWLVGVAHLPVLMLNIDPSVLGGFILFQKLHTVAVHANIRHPGGSWERWLAGPRFHRWHHARDAHNSNFASLLPVFDVVFGTWRLPEGEPVLLGIGEGAASSRQGS